MKDFNERLVGIVDLLCAEADALEYDEEVQAYFKEHYNYEAGLDDALHMVIQYIQDKF